MRTLQYYLISLAINGLVLGLICAAAYITGYTAPKFAVSRGDDTGAAGGNGVPLFEGEFYPPSETTQFRVVPVATSASKEVSKETAEIKPTEATRIFAPAAESKKIARHVDAEEVAPPAPPPPEVSKSVVSRAEASAELPPPPEPKRATGDVDVGALTSAASRPGTADDLSPQPTARPSGGTGPRGGGGGDVGGEPSPYPTNARPPYPAEALARGIEGKVTLRVLVGEDGSVRSASVEFSSGDASLDQSALETVRDQWRFEPARRAGVAIPFEVRVPINFRLRR